MKFWKSRFGRYVMNNLISIDQFGNTLLPFAWGPFAGAQDETISSALGKLKLRNGGKIPWRYPIARIVDAGLNEIDNNHSIDAIENDEGIPVKH